MALPGSFRPISPADLLLVSTIADEGTLTAAARALGITQPAISKQLHRIEAGLGVALFTRGLRGVVPTAFGEAVLPRARSIRSQAEQAAQELQQLRGRREGRVTVALSHSAITSLLPQVLPLFRARWPHVFVRVLPPVFPRGFIGLREGEPDFAVVSLPEEPLGDEYTTQVLYASTAVAVVRPGHPLRHVRHLRELTGSEWVMPSPDSATGRALFRAFARAKLPAPRCTISCETLTGGDTIVRSTDLIGIVPREVQAARAKANGLLQLDLATEITCTSQAMIRWAEARPTPAAQDLSDLFAKAAREFARRKPGMAARQA